MTTLSYPSDRFPAPPSVSLNVPDDWEPVSVPSVALAAKQSGEQLFTPNVIVRLGTRSALDQPADALLELTGAVEGRQDARIGEMQHVELGGLSFVRVDVAWTDPRGIAIRQHHLFTGLPREDTLQDFVHLTGSVGGPEADGDEAVVLKVLESVRVTR
ncbi:hypothetical protein [Phycicoccus sp. SLBN-51]|uniref:hypothetical protein n=1 Tax=Phycicoccus sp. SLBN-51 TaxID=2768447 RepID=UPI001150A7B7|nr:hypothetical protein [Phycicoccus sp. SLBN-51]TQJ48833.1 hypothetical protein FBY26_0496 [Phycicoccus sp. SLBN-51]